MAAFPHGFVRFGPTSAAKEWREGRIDLVNIFMLRNPSKSSV